MTARVWVGAITVTFIAGGCGSDSPFPGEVDCTLCSEDEVCWYTTDFDGEVSDGGCIALPAECAEDRSCACIDAAEEQTCEEGSVQNSNACETIEQVPVVECVTTLG